jgi:hypothetical protein
MNSRKGRWSIAVVIGGCVAAVAFSKIAPSIEAQTTARPGWEYLIEDTAIDLVKVKPSILVDDDRRARFERECLQARQTKFNELGEQGWELAAIQADRFFYFRRPRR